MYFQRGESPPPPPDIVTRSVSRHRGDSGAERHQLASLPTGEEVGALPIGTVSAGLLALSARAERIAFTRCDTAREVQVFRRDDCYV